MLTSFFCDNEYGDFDFVSKIKYVSKVLDVTINYL